jgi:hypothetical protein
VDLRVGIWIFTFTIILTIPPALWVFQIVNGVLYENGTCSNENVTKMYNQTANISGTVDDFLKSLPSDNVILAEMICQSHLNDTISK